MLLAVLTVSDRDAAGVPRACGTDVARPLRSEVESAVGRTGTDDSSRCPERVGASERVPIEHDRAMDSAGAGPEPHDEAVGRARIIYFSSAQVFGFAEGEGTPDYLPVDDTHPLRASRPYGMSKRLAEEMCDAWTSRTAIPTLVLRPVMILDDDGLTLMAESQPELAAFVHVDDVVDATLRAINAKLSGHHRITLCGPGAFDSSRAQHILGWSPSRSWPPAT